MEARHPAIHPSHPGPKRGAVSGWSHLFALLAAPLAWSLDELASYIVAANGCAAKSSGQAETLMRVNSPVLVVLIILTWLIALAGVRTAWRNWSRTHDEHPGGGHHLVELGEGRTRFLAMCALMTSIGFTVAFLYISLQMVAAPLCQP